LHLIVCIKNRGIFPPDRYLNFRHALVAKLPRLTNSARKVIFQRAVFPVGLIGGKIIFPRLSLSLSLSLFDKIDRTVRANLYFVITSLSFAIIVSSSSRDGFWNVTGIS